MIGPLLGFTLTLSEPMYSKPAAPVSVIGVLAEVAVKSIEKGVHVEAVLVVETVKVWLVPTADARMETCGPLHLCV